MPLHVLQGFLPSTSVPNQRERFLCRIFMTHPSRNVGKLSNISVIHSIMGFHFVMVELFFEIKVVGVVSYGIVRKHCEMSEY